MKKRVTDEERAEALEMLRLLLADTGEISTIVTWVSRDGMRRAIVPMVATADRRTGEKKIVNLTHYVIKVGIGEWPRNREKGVLLDGCGMDMTALLVYEIGRVVMGDGYYFRNHSL